MTPEPEVRPNLSTGHSMPSPLVTATLQAACLSALSNVMAQCLRSYRNNEPLRLNPIQLFQFVGFTFLTCPPNFLWQLYLEETFPGKTVHYDGTTSLDKGNTAKKFFIDQTLGAVVNTVIFVGTFAAFKGKDRTAIQREVRRVCDLRVGSYSCLPLLQETFPLMKHGWKLWPAVSLLNFTVVPVHRRILVGGIVGLFWGCFLSIIVAK